MENNLDTKLTNINHTILINRVISNDLITFISDICNCIVGFARCVLL